jgi:hypothetical protein
MLAAMKKQLLKVAGVHAGRVSQMTTEGSDKDRAARNKINFDKPADSLNAGRFGPDCSLIRVE